MRKQRRTFLLLLVAAMMLSACTAAQPQETAAPTEVMQMPTQEPAAEETEAPTEPAEPEGFKLSEIVFPETDKATGTLKFYIKDQEVYAGGPVANLLNAGVTSYDDLEQILQPWHTSSVIRVRVEMDNVEESDLPFVFFIAVNAGNEPKKLSECLLYSVTINTDKGIRFGSGHEKTAFLTGETTKDELFAAYGEPDYDVSRNESYREIAYYEPFNCAYFSFQDEQVRQIYTYYSANIFGDLAKNFEYEFKDSYFGNDCYILMNQYMDVMPYLQAERSEDAALPEGTGILKALTESITLAGLELKMGICCTEMPELFGAPFWGQTLLIHNQRYVRMGRTNPEEFYFMNPASTGMQYRYHDKDVYLNGVVTRNMNYQNWGKDYSNYHEFQYGNLTQDSTIEDVLEQYGMPKELHCTSYARGFFAWLFYEDEAGNTLRICVDPVLNQLMELQFCKYYEGISLYP